MTQDQEPTIICVAEVALDMCGRCALPLNGYTGGTMNHFYKDDPEHATCCAAYDNKFEPAPRFCMLAEEDHKNNIPEIVEALRGADWESVPHSTRPFRMGNEGLLILARAAATALTTAESHIFKQGILCPSCGGRRLVDHIVGSVSGLRSGTRMPIVSDKKTRCSECGGAGVKASTPSV